MMLKLLPALVLLSCTQQSPAVSSTTMALTSPTCNVIDFGATAGDATDDRAAFQAAIAACDTVEIPDGVYIIGRSPSGYWGIETRSRTRLRGSGRATTILRMAPGSANSTRIIKATGDDVTIESLTLDGDTANQTVNGQRHGVFATGTNRLVIRDVLARHFTGDGLYIHAGNTDVTIGPHVVCADNDRNGLTIGATTTGVQVLSSSFVGNYKQQFDSEPGGASVISQVSITGSTFDSRGRSNEYVLTISGSSNAVPGHDWTVWGNTINGGVFIIWVEGVTLSNNVGRNATTKPAVTVARRSRDIVIAGNRFALTQTSVGGIPGIHVYGAGPGDTPSRILITSNSVDLSRAHVYNFGISVTGAVSVTITNNSLRGTGVAATHSAGIYVRATIAAEDFRSATITGNWISDFGHYAVTVNGNGASKLLSLSVRDNVFDITPNSPMQPIVSFDSTGAVQHSVIRDNTVVGGLL